VAAPVALALIAGLGGPLAYSIDTAATAHTGAIPSAGPAEAASFGGPGGGQSPGGLFPRGATGFPGGTPRRVPAGITGGHGGGPGGNASVSAALGKLLEAGAPGYRWAAATVGSTSAASLELGSSGVPVMAIGGFSGSDPAPSLATFEKAVSEHEIHYFVSGGGPGGFGGFGRPASASAPSGDFPGGPAGFAAVGGPGGGSSDASRITSWVEAHFTSETVGGTTVYDLSSPRHAAGSTGRKTAAPGASARSPSLPTSPPPRSGPTLTSPPVPVEPGNSGSAPG
jgi:hypothetical protein